MAIAQKKDLEKIRQKKTKLAINFAMHGQWKHAINANQDILSIFPNDLDALNRLGKSFSELGDIKNAKVTFQNRNILIACDDSGNKIGEIDTKLGARIIRLINGGNKYSASIISCGDNWINIILRETFKSPSQKSIISFPSIDKSSNNFSESRRNLSSTISERELKEIDATYMKDWSNDDTEPGDDTFFEPNMEKIIENIEFET